jgi:uncharacterized protein YjbI with pentapeptide repeats
VQVRKAIVSTIADHLKPGHATNWSDLNFNFTGAVFVEPEFFGAVFSGEASFDEATFTGTYAMFVGATFSDGCTFREATFLGNTVFDSSIFSGRDATFNRVNFTGWQTRFEDVVFASQYTHFDGSEFSGKKTWFGGASFTSEEMTTFDHATFAADRTAFDGAHFSGKGLSFRGVHFTGSRVSFKGLALPQGSAHPSDIRALMREAKFDNPDKVTWESPVKLSPKGS